jgi:hypothetical protein
VDAIFAMESKRGGKRPNAGAPKKDNPAKTRAIRLTDDQWNKLKELGGVEWLRHYLQHIDK